MLTTYTTVFSGIINARLINARLRIIIDNAIFRGGSRKKERGVLKVSSARRE